MASDAQFTDGWKALTVVTAVVALVAAMAAAGAAFGGRDDARQRNTEERLKELEKRLNESKAVGATKEKDRNYGE